jgi:hypothetical protein
LQCQCFRAGLGKQSGTIDIDPAAGTAEHDDTGLIRIGPGDECAVYPAFEPFDFAAVHRACYHADILLNYRMVLDCH